MDDNNIQILKFNIQKLINNKCVKLISTEKNLIIEYLLKTSILLGKYYYNENFINQLMLNNGQDIFGLLCLLIPYIKIENIKELESLNEILRNPNKDAKMKLETTFYVDHSFDDSITLENFLENSYKLIEITMYKIGYKLLPNWINIFPVLMDDLGKNELYQNTAQLFINKQFSLTDINGMPKIGYSTLYGTVYQFLYTDIVGIKWMIYDILNNNEVQPFIIYASTKMEIRDIYDKPYNKLDDNTKEKLQNNWLRIIQDGEELIKFKSLLLFCYKKLLFNSDRTNVKNKVKQLLKIPDKVDDVDEIVDEDNYKVEQDINVIELLNEINNMLSYKQIYEYIYDCVLQLSYTWYGNYILDNKTKHIFDFDTFYNGYPNLNFQENTVKIYYITPKMIYNYFKYLVHTTLNGYNKLSYSNNWNELIQDNKLIFISKLNKSPNNFNIKNNIKNLYTNYLRNKKNDNIDRNITIIHEKILKNLNDGPIIIQVIFETLIINGLLTEYKWNPDIVIPVYDRTLNIQKNPIKIQDKYRDSFNFINNTSYNNCKNVIDKNNKEITCITSIENSRWFSLFGGNWICQIQQYHHFIHNRVMMITGGTGVGKSSVFPMIMLYAYKMINYNNNTKIYCTIPRIEITKNAAKRIASQLGISIDRENNINYIQYKTSTDTILDYNNNDKYHLTLRFMTDGSLLETLKNYPILKKDDVKQNIIDLVLVDESHENNTNMNMILTIIKFGLYINNSLSLGIISATMEDDEYNYRKFYSEIDDNYKYPLDVYIKENNINRRWLDRRMHMGVPFLDTVYEVIDHNDFYKTNPNIKTELDIIKYIMTLPDKGDIIIFKPGEAEIKQLIKEINTDPELPPNLYAVPYYTSLDNQIKTNVTNIGSEDIRKTFTLPKEYSIDGYDTESITKKPEGFYKRFIIVATNIAEASLTIDSLSYVIDDGERKNGKYNPKYKKEILIKEKIATSNRKQRRGRVGRTKKGEVFYTYDISLLSTKGNYEICNKNNLNLILGLLTTSNKKRITTENDPYLVSDYTKINKNLQDQYIYFDRAFQNILYDYPPKLEIKTIIYPYEDGKYNSTELIDKKGIFYIIHPNEDIIIRDKTDYSIIYPFNPDKYVEKDNKIVIVEDGKENIYNITTKETKNKIEIIFEDLTDLDICILNNENYIISDYGKNIKDLLDELFEDELALNEFYSLLQIIAFKKHNKKLYENLIHDMIINIIFIKNTRIRPPTKINANIEIKSDFLAISKLIITKYYSSVFITIDEIKELNKRNEKDETDKNFLEKLNVLIDQKTRESIKTITDKDTKKFYEDILIPYNRYKIKLIILINYDLYTTKLNNIMKENKFDTSILYQITTDDNYKFQVYSYLIAKYYWQYILVKLNETDLYIDYYERDINNLYIIDYSVNAFGKKFISTYVSSNYRNPIYYISVNENKVKLLMFISPYILSLLNKEVKIINTKINEKEIIDINPDYKDKMNKIQTMRITSTII